MSQKLQTARRTRAPSLLRPRVVQHAAEGGLGGHDGIIIRFATLQLFTVIYLQKLAVGPLSFQVSLTIPIMLIHVCFLLISGRMQFAPLRLGCYLAFAASCCLSQVISGERFSLPSIAELLLIYSFLTVTTQVSEQAYQAVLKRFISLMIIPAVIVLFQYSFQKVTGLGNPLSMDRMFPKPILLQGYFYEAHYPWNSPFQRPNGFFFLEPSVVSMFTASAAIIELTYFKRFRYVLLMIGATALSMGGTGMTMLVIAAPFLLARESVPRILVVAVAAAAVLAVALEADVSLPLVSRLGELSQASSSGSGRMLIPAEHLARLLVDPSHLLTGSGAGSTTADFGLAWAVLKLINEYGLLTTVIYVALYVMAFAGSYNVPLRIAISVIFHFTGGYLLDAMGVQFMAIIFCMIVPYRPAGPGRRPGAYVAAAADADERMNRAAFQQSTAIIRDPATRA